jgi:hypothetical protein
MQSWLTNGARVTVAVTAFAAAGAGVACCHGGRTVSGPDPAGHARLELTALALPAGGPLTKEFGLTTGISRPLGCTSYIGKPAGTVRLPAQYTNPSDITGSHRETVTCTTAAGVTSVPPSHSTTPPTQHSTKPGKTTTTKPGKTTTTKPGKTTTTKPGKTTSTKPGKTTTTKPGKTTSTKPGKSRKVTHTKRGKSGMTHHKPASHHHKAGHHKSSHHITGGKPATTAAKKVTTASTAASVVADSSTLPTTGAPMAGLLGLAVAALAAGLVVRRLTKRDDEAEPQES